MPESELTNIVHVIHESFRDTIAPEDDVLAIFGHGHHPEIEPFMEMIRGKDWKDFLHILETHEDGLAYGQMFHFMTPQAYCYFSPALLIFSMDIEKADILAEAFLSSLLPFSLQRHQIYVQERLSLFSDPHLATALAGASMQEKTDVLQTLTLLPAPPEGLQQYTEERLSFFTDLQKHAIALAVDYFYRLYGMDLQPEADLVAYWAAWLEPDSYSSSVETPLRGDETT